MNDAARERADAFVRVESAPAGGWYLWIGSHPIFYEGDQEALADRNSVREEVAAMLRDVDAR